jgi:hypothetical protein
VLQALHHFLLPHLLGCLHSGATDNHGGDGSAEDCWGELKDNDRSNLNFLLPPRVVIYPKANELK